MDRTTIGSLPNELLISILSQLPTRALLPLAAVDRRFYLVTLRILQERLRRATSLHDHRLILECYHPSARLSTPYLYCNYLYTDGFDYDDDDNHNDAAAHASESTATATATTTPLASLRGIYSHFRPVAQDENNRRGNRAGARRHHAPRRAAPPESPPRPAHDVYLDEGELFSQLCTVTNLVRLGPRPDLFRSHVNVSDGLVRVRRAWLAAQAGGGRTTTAGAARGGVGKEEEEEDGAGGAGAVLWADAARNVGLRFRVAEKDISGEQQQPVLVASDEELAVAFRLEFEELLVRTSRLLIMMEKSDAQEEVGAEGKAIVLASIF